MKKTTIIAHRLSFSLAPFMFYWRRHKRLLMTSQLSDNYGVSMWPVKSSSQFIFTAILMTGRVKIIYPPLHNTCACANFRCQHEELSSIIANFTCHRYCLTRIMCIWTGDNANQVNMQIQTFYLMWILWFLRSLGLVFFSGGGVVFISPATQIPAPAKPEVW